jgi:predicted aconitase with swiveling domain
MQRIVKAKIIVEGNAESELVVIRHSVSLLGEFNPNQGIILSFGVKIDVKNKIILIPSIRGSTVGSYVLYAAKENNTAPSGIIALSPDPILITGAVISNIPLYQPLEKINLEEISKYKYAYLDQKNSSIVFSMNKTQL